jgi:hypothetical protein
MKIKYKLLIKENEEINFIILIQFKDIIPLTTFIIFQKLFEFYNL